MATLSLDDTTLLGRAFQSFFDKGIADSSEGELSVAKVLFERVKRLQEGGIYSSFKRSTANNIAKLLRRRIEVLEWIDCYGIEPRLEERMYDSSRTIARASKYPPSIKLKALWYELDEYKRFIEPKIYESAFETEIRIAIRDAEIEESIERNIANPKIKWIRKPSEFGHVFGLLLSKGYIGSHNGMRMSRAEQARMFLEHFEFSESHPSPESLAKELGNSSLPNDVQDLFKIPDVKVLNPIRKAGKR